MDLWKAILAGCGDANGVAGVAAEATDVACFCEALQASLEFRVYRLRI